MSQIINLKTREIRWFFSSAPRETVRWFQGLPPDAYTRETREDIYLVLPGRKDVGIKFRENRLELKYRYGVRPTHETAPGITGYLETWEKLGFELSPETRNAVLPADSGALRLPVEKSRWATLVRERGTGLEFHPLGTPLPEYIQVEYTQLRIRGAQWYTFGLEWPETGDSSLPDALLSNLRDPGVFVIENSMGYPEFLQGFINK